MKDNNANRECEQPKAIEVTPPVHQHWWEAQGGDVTTFRLRLMTREQIAAHGLQKYMPKRGDSNEQ